MEYVDLKKQYESYQEEIDLSIKAVLNHGKYIHGPEIERIEKILAEYVGVNHCVTVSSGTTSLEIALRALSIGPGDEVITVPLTWISSAEVISLVGAKPVFVDIDSESFLMNHELLESAITKQTKAIIPVSLYGQPPKLEEINKIASKYGVVVIEDAAQSFGALRNDIRSCNLSEIASTSFFPAKPLGCYGDGGALFTNNSSLADKFRAIRTHGAQIRHQHELIGLNGRFDTIQAAVLLAKFPHFELEIKKRQEVAQIYSSLLESNFITPAVVDGNTHVYAQYTIRVPSHRREDIMSYMSKKGVPTGIYYPTCLHLQPAFSELGYKAGDFPESERATEEILSIPMHPFLINEEIEFISNNLINALNQ